MPNLGLPILLKPKLTENHCITHYYHLHDDNKFITGSIYGDIIIWKNS